MKDLEQHLLLIPGPTPVPPPVARELSRPMIAHRAPEMVELYHRVVERLQYVFQTRADLFVLASSGTGGMEAAIANTLSPGDAVLCISVGVFGDRFAKIAQAFGMDVDVLAFEWGQAADPSAIEQKLKSGKQYKAVTLTHNETSTAITNDTASIAPMVREHGALFLVDCISGMLCTDFRTDEWDCDVVVAASQKAFMLPPGLCFVSVSPRAWEAVERAKSPRFYFDFRAMREPAKKGQTAYTPAVGLFFGADAALGMILREGAEQVIARHARLAAGVRAGVKALGLKLFSDEAHASNGVTAIVPPAGIDADSLRALLSQRYSVVLSGGQGKLKGQIFRIAHMGAVSEKDLLGALGTLELALSEMGHRAEPGASVAAAVRAWTISH